MKGRLTVDYYAVCSCGHSDVLAEGIRAKAIKAARRMGWKLTRDHGWMCPRCIERMKERRAA